MDSHIEIKRETEFYQGFIRLKLSVSNRAPSVITDVTLDFYYEHDILSIDHSKRSYELSSDKILLGNINSGTSKSITVYFDPLMCTSGAKIECHIIYRDAQGGLKSVLMEPKHISVVCPIIKTDSDINVGRLKEFIEKLPSKDSKVYEIQHGFNIEKLILIVREVVEKHEVRHVRTLKTKDGREWEIWYYGKTKVTKAHIVIKVSISSEKHHIELFAATETAESLTGLLAEFGRDLRQSIESHAGGKANIINVSIKDSIIQRSTLLDLCSTDGICPVNILVEDSVNQHSTLISEKDEAKEENKRLSKEKEELERLRKQHEEALLKKAEEEKLRKQKEEEEKRRQKEIEEKERLRRQQEEAERRQKEQKRQQQEKLPMWREEEGRKKEKKEQMRREDTERKSPEKNTGISSGKGILVFSMIFGILFIAAVIMYGSSVSFYDSFLGSILPSAQSTASSNTNAYIANYGNNNEISVINTGTNLVTSTVKVGKFPVVVTATPDGKQVYVLNTGESTISIINTTTNNIISTVSAGVNPNRVAVSPDGKKLYVTNSNSPDNTGICSVSVIDVAANNVTATIRVGIFPFGIVVSPDGTKVYVANEGSNNVFVIDTSTNSVVAKVNVDSNPKEVAISPDGKTIYVTNTGSNTFSIIDMASNTVTKTVNLGSEAGLVAVTPDGRTLYVANYGTNSVAGNTVSVIDRATNTVMDTVRVGKRPEGIAVTPDGKMVYVTSEDHVNGYNHIYKIDVIDTATNTVKATVPVEQAKGGIAFGY